MSDLRHYILFSSSNAWELQSIPYVRNERYPTIFVYYLDEGSSLVASIFASFPPPPDALRGATIYAQETGSK